MDKKLGIIMPLANEENTIDELLIRIQKEISKNTLIFCVLDNKSKDSTKEKINDFHKKDTRFILVYAPENRCVVDAYFRGYQEAFNNDCDFILEMDGGGSHLPEEIPRFIEAMKNGFDFAGGSRFMKGGRYIKPRVRYLISKGGTMLTNLVLKTKMKDMTSGFECFNRKTMEYLLNNRVKSRAHFFQTEIRYMMHDFKWTEIPITYKDPSKSVGRANIIEAFKILWDLYQQKIKKTLPNL